MRLLVDAGVDVNARQERGLVPLHACAQNGDAAGADPSLAADDGRTALDFARDAGNEHVGKILYARG